MFDHTSRYYNLDTAQFTTLDGRTIAYKRRRFLPQGRDLPVFISAKVLSSSDRLDLITERTLGVPEQFWQVCDANNTMNPEELTSQPGKLIRVPLPQV